MIKLIALDIDGTLLTSQRTISPDTLKALRAASAAGVRIVLATGRAFRSLQDVMEKLGCADYAVTSSGGGVFDAEGNMLFAAKFSPEHVRAVLAAVRRFGTYPELYIRGQAYAAALELDSLRAWGVPEKVCGYILDTRVRVEDMDAFIDSRIADIEGMDVLTAPYEHRAAMRAALEGIDGLAVSSSSPHYVDVNTAGVTKASGLEFLGRRLGIAPGEMAAFGDAENDLPMLSYAGLGIAMGNAAPETAAAARYVTDSNDGEGIAKALRHFGIV